MGQEEDVIPSFQLGKLEVVKYNQYKAIPETGVQYSVGAETSFSKVIDRAVIDLTVVARCDDNSPLVSIAIAMEILLFNFAGFVEGHKLTVPEYIIRKHLDVACGTLRGILWNRTFGLCLLPPIVLKEFWATEYALDEVKGWFVKL